MPEVIVGRVDDPPSWLAAVQSFREWNPGYTLGQGAVGDTAEALLTATPGAVRYCWLFDGRGEVWLPPATGPKKATVRGCLQPIVPIRWLLRPATPSPRSARRWPRPMASSRRGCASPFSAIMERWQRQPAAFVGNVDGEVWRLLESGIAPEQMAGRDAGGRAALARRADGDARLVHQAGRLLGNGRRRRPADRARRCAAPSPRDRCATGGSRTSLRQPGPQAAVRRLRYLKDTAGGCAPGFDAFRRLPLTWSADLGSDEPDNVPTDTTG